MAAVKGRAQSKGVLRGAMSQSDQDQPPRPADILRAALEAKRKAAAKSGAPGAGRASERDAAALSASKSKPAMRR
jgi:hypothetical protein